MRLKAVGITPLPLGSVAHDAENGQHTRVSHVSAPLGPAHLVHRHNLADLVEPVGLGTQDFDLLGGKGSMRAVDLPSISSNLAHGALPSAKAPHCNPG